MRSWHTARSPTGKCVSCSPGDIAPEGGFCFGCLSNTMSSRPGSTTCTQCPTKRVQPLEGQSKCVACKKGLIPRLPRSVSTVAECVVLSTNCPPGQDRFLDDLRLLYACSPRTCPAGTFKAVERGLSLPNESRNICLSCPKNAKYNPMRKGCDFCAENEIAKGGLDREGSAGRAPMGRYFSASGVSVSAADGWWEESARRVQSARLASSKITGVSRVPRGPS